MTKSTNKLLDDIESKSLDEIICNWNINRILVLAVLSIVFQLANLLNPAIYYSDFQLKSVFVLLGLNILFLMFLIVIRLGNMAGITFKQWVYLLFWYIFPLSLSSFYINDIKNNQFPINLFIVLILIAAYPILNRLQTAIIFSVPLALNIAFLFIYKPDINFIIYSAIGMVSALFIAATVHGKYLDVLAELSNSCTYDGLTNILNRHAGYQRAFNMLEMCKRNHQFFCVYMLDIDYFKEYNDTFGHQSGDNALKSVASCIKNTFARSQDIVCRFGGEEFLICCSNQNEDSFEMMAEALLDNIYDLKLEAGKKHISPYITASLGYTVFNTDKNYSFDDVTLDSLIKLADQALYKAKSLGRNQYYKL